MLKKPESWDLAKIYDADVFENTASALYLNIFVVVVFEDSESLFPIMKVEIRHKTDT